VEKEEQMKVEHQVIKAAQGLSRIKERDGSGQFPELGLCNRCSCLQSLITEFGLRTASCVHQMARLDGKQRIKQCSAFWDMSFKSIIQLVDMGPIFINPNKETIGF
jgi:hypothetical protein